MVNEDVYIKTFIDIDIVLRVWLLYMFLQLQF